MRPWPALAALLPALAIAGPKGGGHSSGSHSSGSRSSGHAYSSGSHGGHSGGAHSSGSHSAGSSASHSKATRSTGASHSSSTQVTKPSSTGNPKRDPHGKIERSAQAKDSFRKNNPCPSTGKTTGKCPGYEVDHRTPLACGGADSPSNMQWLTASANRKKGAAGCKR